MWPQMLYKPEFISKENTLAYFGELAVVTKKVFWDLKSNQIRQFFWEKLNQLVLRSDEILQVIVDNQKIKKKLFSSFRERRKEAANIKIFWR